MSVLFCAKPMQQKNKAGKNDNFIISIIYRINLISVKIKQPFNNTATFFIILRNYRLKIQTKISHITTKINVFLIVLIL